MFREGSAISSKGKGGAIFQREHCSHSFKLMCQRPRINKFVESYTKNKRPKYPILF